jgi:serine phosphatase RsbU (regulator of sigma subunit)
MLSNNLKLKISIIISIISWLLFAISSWLVIFAQLNHVSHGAPTHLPQLFYVSFFLSLYIFFRISLHQSEQINLTDLIWRVFATGLIATGISLLIQLLKYSLNENKLIDNDYFESLFFNINAGVLTTFLISTFVAWEKLIFYQKSKMLIYSWRVFVYFMLATLAVTFFNLNIIGPRYQYMIGAIIIISIFYSFNLKWVAYLSSKHKWTSILLLVLTIAYLVYFIYIFLPYYRNEFLNLFLSDVTLMIMFGFVITYALIAFLVLLFNLPTSPVFEKKLEEIVNFQRLSQAYNTGRKVDEIYEILLESAVSAVRADAAWLDLKNPAISEKKCLTFQIDSFQILEIKNRINKSKIHRIYGAELIKNIKSDRPISGLKNNRFRSILIFTILVQNEHIGTLALLKEISDGFNHDMINVIKTFVDQASISIENHRLFETVLENERYVKELNIARTVQNNLLPESMGKSELFDITAYSRSADEVGGDYFDIFYKENYVLLIIADVSSKGTSAVFHMSQMKGIFHSLAQIDLHSDEFLTLANNALSKGLDKSSFITVSLFRIDAKMKSIELSRAGHCPALFYSAKKNCAEYLYGEGIGLGIMRNQEFKSHVNIHRIEFEADDILLLFTDGIIEAKNLKREEFGYERLKNLLISNSHQNPDKIKEIIIFELYRFCETKSPEDDYSMIILKFRKN